MFINNKTLCPYCFTESSLPCPACGYSGGEGLTFPTALPVSTVLLGRYIIGKTLGKGGFGITYLAYDSVEDKKVAVKEYFPDTLSYRNPGYTQVSTYQGEKEDSFKLGVEKFYDEAQMISRFNGKPGLIWVNRFFYENQTAYFVMEYLEGMDLKAYFKSNNGVLSERQIIAVITPLIESLIIVHGTGVLHRDISADNIYITNDGRIKLLDFGAARQVLGEATNSLSVILKQGFAPIEQYQSRGKQGPWTDVYALGATIYYCLTGKVPDAPMGRLEADHMFMPENASDGFRIVLQKMLAVRPGDRYQNFSELARDMTAYGLLNAAPPPPESDKAAEAEEQTPVSADSPSVAAGGFFSSRIFNNNLFASKKMLMFAYVSICAAVVLAAIAIIWVVNS
jgi:serine/threonine protein kinase